MSEKNEPLSDAIPAPHARVESGASVDDALAVVGDHAQPVDPIVARRVVRKIDLILIPAMFTEYGLVYWDKAILGSAAILGMTADLKLAVIDSSTTPPTVDTSRLSWATSLFYFGMLAGLPLMAFLVQRFRVAHVLSPVVVLWGARCMATAGVGSYKGLYAQRFALGFAESIIPTCFSYIITSFYTQQEQALRQSWWFSSVGAWTIIGGSINYAFTHVGGGALAKWQYLYLFAGSLTILFGISCVAIPDSPMAAWFLNPDERVVAVERLRSSQTGIRNHSDKTDQIIEALLDVKIWLVFIMMAAAYTINGAVAGFGPLIVSTFGYTTLESILLQFPLGGVTLIGILIVGWLASHIPNIRIAMLIACCLPVIARCAMIWKSAWTHRPATPVVGYTLIGFFGPVVSLVISLGMANVAGATKKSFMAATIFVAYCVGNIVGPQLIKSQTKRRHYPELWTGIIICYCIAIVAALMLYVALSRANKQRSLRQLGDGGDEENEKDAAAFKDLTDRQNIHFRYAL